MIRLTWAQPEDLVAHALVAKRLDGDDADEIADRWVAAGGSLERATQRRNHRTSDANPACSRPRAAQRTRPRSASGGAARRRTRRSRRDLGVGTRGVHGTRQRRSRRPGARRLAGPGGRVPARQAGREDHPRGHPGNRRIDRQLAARGLFHRHRPRSRRCRRLSVEQSKPLRPAWPRTSPGCPRTTT